MSELVLRFWLSAEARPGTLVVQQVEFADEEARGELAGPLLRSAMEGLLHQITLERAVHSETCERADVAERAREFWKERAGYERGRRDAIEARLREITREETP